MLTITDNHNWTQCREQQIVGSYGGLNENGCHRIIYLSAWSPLGGTV